MSHTSFGYCSQSRSRCWSVRRDLRSKWDSIDRTYYDFFLKKRTRMQTEQSKIFLFFYLSLIFLVVIKNCPRNVLVSGTFYEYYVIKYAQLRSRFEAREQSDHDQHIIQGVVSQTMFSIYIRERYLYPCTTKNLINKCFDIVIDVFQQSSF